MMAPTMPLSVSIAVCDQALRHKSQQALQAFFPSMIGSGDKPGQVLELVASAAAARPAVLIADLAALGESFGDTIRKLRAQATPPDIIILHKEPDGGAILKAMRAGAREFFFEDVENSLRETVAAIASESRPQQANGKLFAFIAAKGGCGVTTLASYAAASLARDPAKQVLLADMHWSSPSTAFLLRATPRHTMQAALLRMDRMDHSLWDAMISTTPYGFALAPPPSEDANQNPVDPASLSALLKFCKSQHGNIVVDCGHGVNLLTPTLIEAADEIILVTTTDVISLHHTKRLLRMIQELPLTSRVRLVLNRVRRRPDMGHGELENMLGHPVFASVANDYRSLSRASEEGALLPPDHSFFQSVGALSAQLTGSGPERKKRRFALFGN